MLPLETKQSGGKLLPHSDLRGGVFLEKVSRSQKLIYTNYTICCVFSAGERPQAAHLLKFVGSNPTGGMDICLL